MLRKYKKRVLKILILLFLFVFILFMYFSTLNQVINNTTRLTLDSIAKKAINLSVNKVTAKKPVYNDMIDIKYKETGEISLIQVKSYEANKICGDIIDITEQNIQQLGNDGIAIKTGVFTNIPILSAVGNNINLKFRQIGAVNCVYSSKFVTAGINQNIHKLYVNIHVRIGIAFPFHTEVVEVSQEVMLCENIIVGEVPYTYLQSTELDSLLNLVPS